MSTEIHLDWQGEPHLVGRLFVADRGTTASFEYDASWLRRADAFAIDPTGLPLQRSAHHAPVLFGAIQDTGPDRWGHLLIERAVRRKLLVRQPWRALDFVLALDDTSRIGALRFRETVAGPFLATGSGRLPPLVRLASLLQAADAIHRESETAADLRFLLAEGSPLGGARPKSAVLLEDGTLGIAKFPKPDDTHELAAGEILALTLARGAGITVADHRRVAVAGRGVALIRRFDRVGDIRIPFVSAATLLGLSAGETATYTGIADGIRRFGDQVPADLSELWRRMVFSLLISNFDDHARNHGFLMHRPGCWALSPAYDLNPVPETERASVMQTAISEDDDRVSIEAALAAAGRFSLKPAAARGILSEVVQGVSRWRETGRTLRLKATTLDAYASAFEQPCLAEARRLMK